MVYGRITGNAGIYGEIKGLVRQLRKGNLSEGARREHIDYFLQGIGNESENLFEATNSASIYAYFNSLSLGMSKKFDRGFVRETKRVFDSAISLSGNTNKLLQAVYLPEENLDKNERKNAKVANLGDAYDLRDITLIEKPVFIEDVNTFKQDTEQYRTIRNSILHGNSHHTFDNGKIIYNMKGERIEIPRKEISGFLSACVERDNLGFTRYILKEISQDSEASFSRQTLRDSLNTFNDVSMNFLFGDKIPQKLGIYTAILLYASYLSMPQTEIQHENQQGQEVVVEQASDSERVQETTRRLTSALENLADE